MPSITWCVCAYPNGSAQPAYFDPVLRCAVCDGAIGPADTSSRTAQTPSVGEPEGAREQQPNSSERSEPAL